MRKEIVKFVTGTLVNVLMSIIILFLLGVPNAGFWGLIVGVVLPIALGKFLPKGAALEGVYTEVWTGELVKQLRGGMTASFLDGVSDYSAAVNNEVVHLVDVGGDPDVLINNTTYPIATQELEDGDIALGLDKFQTKKTAVSDDQLFAISYDKMGSVIERHGDAITIAKFKKAAHALAPNSNTAKTPVVPTSGEDDNGRKKCTRKDIIALKRKLDDLQIPAAGRRLVLCSDHVNDLLEDDQKFRDQYYNYTTGKIANMYGFEVYEFENCPYFTKEGTKVPFKNSPSGTDHQASFCFYTKRVFRAQGSTKMYYRDAQTNPDYQQNEVNFRHYYIVLPKKMEALGAIYSYDGTTEQTSDQEVEADKNWATVRREAEAAKMAMVLSEGGAKGVNGLEEKLQEDPAAGEELEA
ncbi:hypothetical protein [Phocaeicola coprophilus]|jgi:hypothetical protein|uniref:hypothetical protein n=1 Tax=Phocaeicola coprophilus TaxID=387090 RepID=UPI00204ACE0F|nr:hypothetical protein [Phocaeicola coprophilus]DAV51668.1 MAG TPA: Major capsid protein [Caudoviricetes sp.]